MQREARCLEGGVHLGSEKHINFCVKLELFKTLGTEHFLWVDLGPQGELQSHNMP